MFTVHCRDSEVDFSTTPGRKQAALEFAQGFVIRNRHRRPSAEVTNRNGKVVMSYWWDGGFQYQEAI